MIRDTKMMELVACEKEPITPFVRVVSSLYQVHGISTILVVGGTGDFFDVAHHVLVLDSYTVQDATAQAKEIASRHCSAGDGVGPTAATPFVKPSRPRRVHVPQFAPNGKVKVLARNVIAYGDTESDLGAQEQIVADGQTTAITCALQRLPPQQKSLFDTVQAMEAQLNNDNTTTLDAILAPGQLHGGLVRPRPFEIGAALNRLRRENCIQ